MIEYTEPKSRLKKSRDKSRLKKNIIEQTLSETTPKHVEMLQSLSKGAGQARYTPEIGPDNNVINA